MSEPGEQHVCHPGCDDAERALLAEIGVEDPWLTEPWTPEEEVVIDAAERDAAWVPW